MKEERNGLGNGHHPPLAAQAVLDRTSSDPASVTGDAGNAYAGRVGDYQALRGIRTELHKGMFDHGYARAIDGRVTKSREEDVNVIRGLAEKSARECARDAFDEESNLHDRMHKEEHDKHRDDRRHAEEAEKFAYAEMRERAVEAAQVSAGTPPRKSIWIALGVVATVALAISFVLTFHDVFFTFSDEVMSWFVSFVAAAVIGAVIAVMILADTGSDGHRSASNWIGLAGGVLIAVGFGAARLRDAETSGEYVFTLALMLFELGIVVGLEGIAMRLRAANRDYTSRLEEERRAQALLAEAGAHYRHCQQRVRDLDAAVRGDIGYVEEIHRRHTRIEELVEAMVAAGLDGYYAGIAANNGVTLGAKRRN